MKKLIISLAAAASLSLSAQPTVLYKISGNGLAKPSYVYGTIHVTCDATLEPSTIEAMKNTSQLYLELDMDDPGMQMAMMQGMTMEDGKTLQSMVSDEDWKKLDAVVKAKLGVSATMLNTVKPFFLSTMFLPSLLDCPMKSIEGSLMTLAKEQQEEVYGLETLAEQMAVFDKIPYDVQMAELMESVRDNFASSKAEMKELMAVYRSKNLEIMKKLIETSDNRITAEHQEALLFTRNRNWIPRIEKIAKEKPTFFGVGAGHLPGAQGVLALLRERGYTVEPVQ